MEASDLFETSVYFDHITWRFISEDINVPIVVPRMLISRVVKELNAEISFEKK